MPWKALDYNDPLIETLNARFNVEGIPTLILLNKAGKVVTDNGRAYVTEDPEGYPWSGVAKPLLKLNGITVDMLNQTPILLLLCDGKDESKYEKLLEPIANEYAARWEGKDAPLKFVLGGGHELVERVKQFLNVKKTPSLLLVNLPDGVKYVPTEVGPGTITTDSIKSFIDDYLTGGRGLIKKKPKE